MPCERCGAEGEVFYTELYDPPSKEHRTAYLCRDCQHGLFAVAVGFVGNKYPRYHQRV